jgi:hypothetical protein
MTYDQYWYGDPLMVRAFYAAHQLQEKQRNYDAWLHGAYVCRALEATVGNMFRKKGTQAIQYPKQPVGMENETQGMTERDEEEEKVWAKAYMMQMVRAGKNWGKK